MSLVDRRSGPRVPHPIRFAFFYRGRRGEAMAMDLGPGGAFLNTRVFPPVGALLKLEVAHLASQGTIVRFLVEVRQRREQTSNGDLPGVGVQWLRGYCNQGTNPLVDFMRDELRVPTDIVQFAADDPSLTDGEVVYEFTSRSFLRGQLTYGDATAQDEAVAARAASSVTRRAGSRPSRDRPHGAEGSEAAETKPAQPGVDDEPAPERSRPRRRKTESHPRRRRSDRRPSGVDLVYGTVPHHDVPEVHISDELQAALMDLEALREPPPDLPAHEVEASSAPPTPPAARATPTPTDGTENSDDPLDPAITQALEETEDPVIVAQRCLEALAAMDDGDGGGARPGEENTADAPVRRVWAAARYGLSFTTRYGRGEGVTTHVGPSGLCFSTADRVPEEGSPVTIELPVRTHTDVHVLKLAGHLTSVRLEGLRRVVQVRIENPENTPDVLVLAGIVEELAHRDMVAPASGNITSPAD